MAHKIITIEVVYDDAHQIPDDEMLRRSVESYVGDGMLNPDDSADTVIDTFKVSIDSTPLVSRVLASASDHALQKVYRLKIDVDEPESGPPMEAGWLVKILDDRPTGVLVESVDEHEDSGNGEDEPTMERSVARVSMSDLKEV